jgi:hypothetical protein
MRAIFKPGERIAVVKQVKICEADRISIKSEPMGDLFHSSAVSLYRADEPGPEDVVKIAKGGWPYKLLWLAIYVGKPPVHMRLDIHTHHSLLALKREYVAPLLTYAPLQEEVLEGTYSALLNNYGYQVALLTLPGDRIFMHLYSRHGFQGELSVLNCGFFR